MQEAEKSSDVQEVGPVLQVEKDIPWLPQPNEGRIILAAQLPPREEIATAIVLAFSGDRLLQTRLVKRGWDIVGGHVEEGEVPEEAVRREAYEEAGAKLGTLHLLGYQCLRLLGPRPASYKYSYPNSYQLFYWARIEALDDFIPTPETRGPALFSPDQAQTLPWVQAHLELYRAALALQKKEINMVVFDECE